MKKATGIFAVVALVLCTAGLLGAQSLGDLARKEKERRQTVKQPVKVVTNDETARYQAGAVTTGTISKPAGDADPSRKADPAQGKPAASDEPTDFQGRTESFWRQTFSDARKRVTELEAEANVITLRIADLQNRFYAESDGFKQQDIQREVQKSIYEQDLNKQNLQKARQQLTDLETEARKSGALPGWMSTSPAKP
jgi:hypothetical protein